jgi:hypothetical protein
MAGNSRSGGPGPSKGERRGGRAPGTPNRATVERLIEAERANAVAQKERRKLGKEILDDFMQLFARMAAFYQPTPPSAAVKNPNADETTFLIYAKLAVDTAYKLAEFQSPKFRATPTPGVDDMMPDRKASLAQSRRPAGKPIDAYQAYQMLRDGIDTINIAPLG